MKSMTMIAMLIVISAAPTWGASIGLFSTPDGSSCTLRIPPGQSYGTMYICASAGGPDYPWSDFDRAMFKVVGLPPGWSTYSNPVTPGAQATGDPFGAGVIITSGGSVWSQFGVLLNVALIPPLPGAEAILHVTGMFPPPYNCPTLENPALMCAFCPFCVSGGTLLVNTTVDCSVGIQPSTWSRVKGLYK